MNKESIPFLFENIKKILKKEGINLKSLAHQIGITPEHLRRVFMNPNSLTSELFYRVREATFEVLEEREMILEKRIIIYKQQCKKLEKSFEEVLRK